MLPAHTEVPIRPHGSGGGGAGAAAGDDPAVRAALARLGPDPSPVRAWEPRSPGRVMYADRDIGGWNNIIMAFEVELGLARDGGYAVMLPRPQTWYLLGQRPREIFDYFDEATFRSVVPCVDYDPLAVLHQVTAPPPPAGAPSAGGGEDRVQLVYRLFGRVEARHRGWLDRALRFRADLLAGAERRLAEHRLRGNEYVAIHVRRGDLQYTQVRQVPNETIAQHLADTVRDRDVLLLSDEFDPGLVALLRERAGARRVVCWAQRLPPGPDQEGLAGVLDMLCAVPARHFVGTPLSTFSSGIVRLRRRAGAGAGAGAGEGAPRYTHPFDEQRVPDWGRLEP